MKYQMTRNMLRMNLMLLVDMIWLVMTFFPSSPPLNQKSRWIMNNYGPVAELVKHRPFKACDRQFESDRGHNSTRHAVSARVGPKSADNEEMRYSKP